MPGCRFAKRQRLLLRRPERTFGGCRDRRTIQWRAVAIGQRHLRSTGRVGHRHHAPPKRRFPLLPVKHRVVMVAQSEVFFAGLTGEGAQRGIDHAGIDHDDEA